MTEIELEKCPFCKEPVTWCDAVESDDDPHECHIIRCVPCDANFDMCAEEQTPEGEDTLEDFKKYCANKFNKRGPIVH